MPRKVAHQLGKLMLRVHRGDACMALSLDQQRVFDACMRGQNIVVTGPGGSGKSHLIRTIVERMRVHGRQVQVCALTGCAAVLLECGAKTVHSWGGIGLANGEVDRVIDRVCRNKFKRVAWTKVDLLIVDEISMMSKKLFDILDGIARKARHQRAQPFGGLQLLFSGDFYQLPPVGDRAEPDTCAFCFESANWAATFPETVELRKIYRQADPAYKKVLNQIRRGKLSPTSLSLLEGRVRAVPQEEGLLATRLVPRRRDADAINRAAMNKLDGEVHTYGMSRCKADALPMNSEDQQAYDAASPREREAEVERLWGNVMVEPQLELKLGAQVMCVANIDMEGPRPIVNGSRGIVTGFTQDLPVVTFRDGQVQVMGRHVWPSEVIPGVGVEQVPLIHAWAITIHKAQGVSLDMAEIDAGGGVFECGQTYVALSRVKSLDGLYLTGFDPAKIRVEPKVRAFYDGLKRTSGATRVAPPTEAAAPPPPRPASPERPARAAPRRWSKAEDAALLEVAAGGGDPASRAQQEKLRRGRRAILKRLANLRDPQHKAYQRLHCARAGLASLVTAAARA